MSRRNLRRSGKWNERDRKESRRSKREQKKQEKERQQVERKQKRAEKAQQDQGPKRSVTIKCCKKGDISFKLDILSFQLLPLMAKYDPIADTFFNRPPVLPILAESQ